MFFEIVIPFYMLITALLMWVVFSPFAEIENLDQWSIAKVEISDLLACFLPFAISLAIFDQLSANFAVARGFKIYLMGAIALSTLASLLAGLFIRSKIERMSPLKRMAMIGFVFPFGLPYSIVWSAPPILAVTSSTQHFLLTLAGTVLFGIILRALSIWICHGVESV